MTLIKNYIAAHLPRMAVIVHDLCMVALTWYGLHHLRYTFSGQTPKAFSAVELGFVLLAQGLVFWRVGLYRGVWRFASVPDLWNILKASTIGLLAVVLVLFFYNRADLVSRSVLLIYPLVLTMLLGGPRLLYRMWKDYNFSRPHKHAMRVLILGAGRAGEALVRDLLRTGAYSPVGFLDDAEKLRGSKLQGIPVLGRLDEVATIAPETAAQLLVIAMPSMNAEQMRRVVELCEQTGLPCRTVPRLDDVLEGRSLPGELKELAIEDLLGRKPVMPDWKSIHEWLGGRSVLVTGAGGSIGSELCRQCAKHGARQIVLVEIDELSLITIEAQLRRDFPGIDCIPVLGDCGDAAVLRYAFTLSTPDAVFHAAAYKQVPILETQLREAVRNNAIASLTVAEESLRANVGTFVLISTDKAVNPINYLGATKRLAEMFCQALAEHHSHSRTRFITVRFGNVLDSAGSVVPLFREQIRRGGPITVTDPEVTRFFMTIAEAGQLILQASAIGSQRAVYTLDMGEPVLIRILAEQMIRLAGKQVGKDVSIIYTGLRPGEKLHETLFHDDEQYRPTSHPKILQAGAREVPKAQTLNIGVLLREAVQDYDLEKMHTLLCQTVIEFKPEVGQEHNARPELATIVNFPSRQARRP